jgi:hypothetical protein
MNFTNITNNELLELWDTEVDFTKRDGIIDELKKRDLFPSKGMKKWEEESGAYPSIEDNEFLQKLLSKREFAESLQSTWKPSSDICSTEKVFEVTAVQRFVSNLLSPKTPYMSALLYHGVGVGKTCSGVQIAEAWLETFPHEKAIIVAPPTIQAGFIRTIFDIKNVRLGTNENEPNTVTSQCTGDLYLRLSNTLYERDLQKIEKQVLRVIQKRYQIFGYIAFANYIKKILKPLEKIKDTEKALQKKKDELRKEFSGKLLIVDEAHNLRDIAELPDTIDLETVVGSDDESVGGESDEQDKNGGKILTPFLTDVIKYSEGLKLVLMTATPMYNSYREIIFIINLLLMNDKKATIKEDDIFIRGTSQIKAEGEKLLGDIAHCYISYMRGENPMSFPIRLFPFEYPKIEKYPSMNIRGNRITDDFDTSFVNNMPIVNIQLKGDSYKASRMFINELQQSKEADGGISSIYITRLMQASNLVVPSVRVDGETDAYMTEQSAIEEMRKRTDIQSLELHFTKEVVGGELRYRAIRENGAEWLAYDNIEQYSPKIHYLLDKLKTSRGVSFVYSRFVPNGAIPIALALEANGYTPWGRKSLMLSNGIQVKGGRQCALCSSREINHGDGDGRFDAHSFTPAYYGILTGRKDVTIDKEAVIQAERDIANKMGVKMKVIIGSQIASEGVDFRFVRETHIFDPWLHLNKIEQIVGRAIRFCSHSALDEPLRNNTTYLYATTFPGDEFDRETIDLYSYRVAFKKAKAGGKVSRILKINAIDCNLNIKAVLIKGQPEKEIILDAQNNPRNIVINDRPFTAVCDWIDTCDYECNPTIQVKPEEADDSTYDQFSARWRENQLRERLRRLFYENSHYRADYLWGIFGDVPRIALVELFTKYINNKSFVLTNKEGITGFIKYCNGYYVFQPSVYDDMQIPMVLRTKLFPVKRDNFTSKKYEIEAVDIVPEKRKDEVDTRLISIWRSIVEWAEALSNSSEFVPIPHKINELIENISLGNKDITIKLSNIIEMIEWFHISYVLYEKTRDSVSRINDKVYFKQVIMEYFYDEWFTLKEKEYLHSQYFDDIGTINEYSKYMIGNVRIQRFINPDNGDVEYICDNGEPCKPSYVNVVLDNKDEPIQKIVVNMVSTGELYGFIVPKSGSFVFKTNTPPIVGGKIGKGQECANVSTSRDHLMKLAQLGEIFEKNGLNNFGLSPDIFDPNRKILLKGSAKIVDADPKRIITNPTRSCAVMDFVLRYMDKLRIEKKRWFFREVDSYYTQHKGTFSKK